MGLGHRPLKHLMRFGGLPELLIQRARAVSEERALLCEKLHEQGADSLEYVLAVRNHPEATVLMLPHRASAFID